MSKEVERLRKIKALANNAGATAGEREAAEAMAKKVERKILRIEAAPPATEKIKVEAARPMQEQPAPEPSASEPYPISWKIERFLRHPLGSLATGTFFLIIFAIMKTDKQAAMVIGSIFYIVAVLTGAIFGIRFIKDAIDKARIKAR